MKRPHPDLELLTEPSTRQTPGPESEAWWDRKLQLPLASGARWTLWERAECCWGCREP